MIKYKAEEAGRTVVKIDRWFPSTRRCSECGHVTESKPPSVQSWECPRCETTRDRDINAAENIRRWAGGSLPKGWRLWRTQ